MAATTSLAFLALLTNRPLGDLVAFGAKLGIVADPSPRGALACRIGPRAVIALLVADRLHRLGLSRLDAAACAGAVLERLHLAASHALVRTREGTWQPVGPDDGVFLGVGLVELLDEHRDCLASGAPQLLTALEVLINEASDRQAQAVIMPVLKAAWALDPPEHLQ